jgi:hypothetical protein
MKDKLYPGPDATTGQCNLAYPCTLANDGSCLCTVEIFEKRSWNRKQFRKWVSTNKISRMKKRPDTMNTVMKNITTCVVDTFNIHI